MQRAETSLYARCTLGTLAAPTTATGLPVPAPLERRSRARRRSRESHVAPLAVHGVRVLDRPSLPSRSSAYGFRPLLMTRLTFVPAASTRPARRLCEPTLPFLIFVE